MKKICFVSAALAIVFFVSGCTSMILNAHKKIEPIAFEVNPPTKKKFKILIPDEQVAKTIIGKWGCKVVCCSFSKLDLNGKPFMYTNLPMQVMEDTWSFTGNGRCSYTVISFTVDPRTSAVSKTENRQEGTWKCINGVLQISLYNKQNKKYITITAAAVWSDPNSMELRYDGNSYQQIITQSLAAEAQQQGADVKSELYYDDIGNCYITINISGVSNRMKFNNNVIMKKTRQIFKKLK